MLVRHQGSSLVVFAPAKLNLFLEILAKRPDGYHQLETVMVSVGLHDTLCFTADGSSQIRLRCRSASDPTSPPLPVNADNLVVRAAELLRTHTGSNRGVSITLTKRIPMQAGLGGGSSDAAATLLGLNRLWELGLSVGELHTLAARLGSDVNFFLDSSRAAICHGRGELVQPVTVARQLHFVVACPLTRLSTAEVFRHCTPSQAPRDAKAVLQWLSARHPLRGGGGIHNALEAPAEGLSRGIRDTLQDLQTAGVMTAAMSGSGSACFGVCRSRRHARDVANRMHQRFPGWVRAVDCQI